MKAKGTSELPKSTSATKGKMTATKSATVQRNRENKKSFILDTAAQLFAEYGYNATSMDMLSDVTELNKGTLYYYYTSKPDILFDICVSTTEKHFRVVSAASKMSDAVDGLSFLIETSINFIVENRDYCQVYYQEEHFFESIFDRSQLSKVRQQQRRFMQNIYEVIENGISSGQFRDVDVKTSGRLIYGVILGPYRWQDYPLDGTVLIDQARALILQGLQQK